MRWWIRVIGPAWIFLDLEGSVEEVLLTKLGEGFLGIVVHVVDQGDRPCLRSFFEMGEERVDGGRKLLLPRGWFWVLQVQVPKLFGNRVQVARNGLMVWLRLVGVVVELEDEAHLKHNESVR